MPRRVKAAAAELTAANVTLSQPLSPEEAATAAQEVVRSLLFLRGQLPCLYEAMLAERDAAGKSASRSSSRQLRLTLASLEAVTAAFTPELFADTSLRSVHLLLGSSASRPRESYELCLATGQGRAATTGKQGQGRPGRAADVARRAIRALVSALVTSPSTAPRQRLFVLISCAHAHDGFLLRRTLKPQFAKARLRARLSIAPSGGGVPEANGDGEQGGTLLWLARAKFRGLSSKRATI